MKKIFLFAAFLIIFAYGIFAQGGKAEPNRITFAKGKNSATKTGALKTSQQAEYIFAAKEGQKVKIKIVSTTPKGAFHFFSLLGDGFDFATEYDKNFDYEFVAPQTGNYLLDVYFNPTPKVNSGKYSLTLTIIRDDL